MSTKYSICFSGTLVAIVLAAAEAPASLLTGGIPDSSHTDLLLWLRADTNFVSGATTTWTDQSSNSWIFEQSVLTSQPTQNPSGLNGQATIDFDGGDHLAKASGTLTGYQSTFIVYQDTSTAPYASPFGSQFNPPGGNGSSFHGQINDGGIFNSGNTDVKTLGGDNYRNGVGIGDGTTTPRPDAYAIDAHVATGPLTGDILFLGSGECCGAPPSGRKINGGIAEILMYDRALNFAELNEIGNYLENRYGITWQNVVDTTAPPLAANQIALADVINGGDGTDQTPAIAGLHKANGSQQTGHTAGVITGTGFQAVGLAMVDGVGVLDGGTGGLFQYNSLGDTAAAPDTNNQSWDHAFNEPSSGGNGVLSGVNYNNVDGHTLIDVHASSFVTFDLDAIEAFHGLGEITQFTAVAGSPNTNVGGDLEYLVYLDGILVDSQVITNATRGMGFAVDVAIDPGHRFLALAGVDLNNDISFDQIIFGDLLLTFSQVVPEPKSVGLLMLGTLALIGFCRLRRGARRDR